MESVRSRAATDPRGRTVGQHQGGVDQVLLTAQRLGATGPEAGAVLSDTVIDCLRRRSMRSSRPYVFQAEDGREAGAILLLVQLQLAAGAAVVDRRRPRRLPEALDLVSEITKS